jgi:hypothetical protein
MKLELGMGSGDAAALPAGEGTATAAEGDAAPKEAQQ